jgi:hypothetical protein
VGEKKEQGSRLKPIHGAEMMECPERERKALERRKSKINFRRSPLLKRWMLLRCPLLERPSQFLSVSSEEFCRCTNYCSFE